MRQILLLAEIAFALALLPTDLCDNSKGLS